jgi:uncharacterized protein YodC (DUF2158 family)
VDSHDVSQNMKRHDSFTKGDVVRARSGGPLMTVHAVGPTGIHVIWWRGASVQGGVFDPESLMVIEDTEPNGGSSKTGT